MLCFIIIILTHISYFSLDISVSKVSVSANLSVYKFAKSSPILRNFTRIECHEY